MTVVSDLRIPVNGELQQFAVNARRSPAGILAAHAVDRCSNFQRYRQAPRLAALDSPRPEHTKCLPMPSGRIVLLVPDIWSEWISNVYIACRLTLRVI
jgi:hypothetical protein